MMDPTIKADWTTALRSGEYAQSQEVLHDANGYCCLGVLLDVAIKKSHLPELNLEWADHGRQVEYTDLDANESEESEVLTEEQLGDYLNGKFGITHQQEADLINMNDGVEVDQATFGEIANYIEENL